MSVDILPDLLSLDVTAGLVKSGRRAAWKQPATTGGAATYTLSILDASNTSPIVLTIPANSLATSDMTQGVRPGQLLHVVVAGVEGNTAANNLDAKNQRNEAWIARVVDATHLALYSLSRVNGSLVASTGNGAYTTGGTVSKGLLAGSILLGQEHIKENESAPRIVMVPSRISYEPATAQTGYTVAALSDDEPGRQRLSMTTRTVIWWYRVHIWGAALASVAEPTKRSFGTCAALHEQVLRSAHDLFNVCVRVGSGAWIDQEPGSPQRVNIGHELGFELGFACPVPREAAQFAPTDIDVISTLSISINGGAPEEV